MYIGTYVKCALVYMHYLYVQYACQGRDLDFVEICDGNHQTQYLTLAKQVLLTG